jgi:hypothetical protein
MLEITFNNPCFKDVAGYKLAARLRRGDLCPTHKALLAFGLQSGELVLHHLTRLQACAVTTASAGYVATLSKATTAEIEAVKRGELRLNALHKKPLTDAQVERLIMKIGAERIMAALDRLTMPQRCEATADMFVGN